MSEPSADLPELDRQVEPANLTLPVTQARERFSEVVAAAGRAPVFLTRRGRGEAVVISMAEYQRLLEAQDDAEDLAAADVAMAEIEAGAPTYPWEQVKADLGLA
ncbi:MAG: type II toxin-antitoxin system Phd/YefM family antitoxin [Candidatus Nanopelagicales bacterium]